MPLALTDHQLSIITTAAQPVPNGDRSRFLQEVAEALASCPTIGDGTVVRVCRDLQGKFFNAPRHTWTRSASAASR